MTIASPPMTHGIPMRVEDNSLRSDDRIIQLKVKDGSQPKNSIGLVDNRLFSGKNRLHAYRDQQEWLWKLRYDVGQVPPPLKQSWTSFNKLMETLEIYFRDRNIEVSEVKD